MYQRRPNLHSLMTDAGEDIRHVCGNYPAWMQGERPGWYYKLVTWNIVRCVTPHRWQTLTQWEALPGLHESLPELNLQDEMGCD